MTTTEFANKIGVPQRKIISWTERGYIKPSIRDADGHGSIREWNNADLLRGFCIKELEPLIRPSALRKIVAEEERGNHLLHEIWDFLCNSPWSIEQ
jgi:DNA-binding transcriptional MerR regulator